MKKFKKMITLPIILIITGMLIIGCSMKETNGEEHLLENVVITETGEVLEKETEDAETPSPATTLPVPTPIVEIKEPEQEQVITEEDQIEPTENEMQIVFLGDSIFDNSRDGTGIPYLTSVQCKADVYNLAIGGTSATVENGEPQGHAEWTSRSLVGVVNAMLGNISTDIFAGTRTKEILDNPNVDFTATNYFVIEYGINDFFRAVSHNNPDKYFDVTTYSGALRYAVVNLKSLAPEATIILCGPNYAQFYAGDGRFIGDGNTLNTGNGTLFDYKGTCQYVANEQETWFFDAYGGLGIDGYTAEEYLEDGVHLTKAGRQLYADALAKMILQIEDSKNVAESEAAESSEG